MDNLELPAGFMISLPIMKSTIWQESCWTTFYCTTLSHYSKKYHGAFLVSWPRLRITTAVKVQINLAKFTLQQRYKPGNINVTTFILQHYNVTIVSVSWFTHHLIVFFNFTVLFSFNFLFWFVFSDTIFKIVWFVSAVAQTWLNYL